MEAPLPPLASEALWKSLIEKGGEIRPPRWSLMWGLPRLLWAVSQSPPAQILGSVRPAWFRRHRTRGPLHVWKPYVFSNHLLYSTFGSDNKDGLSRFRNVLGASESYSRTDPRCKASSHRRDEGKCTSWIPLMWLFRTFAFVCH